MSALAVRAKLRRPHTAGGAVAPPAGSRKLRSARRSSTTSFGTRSTSVSSSRDDETEVDRVPNEVVEERRAERSFRLPAGGATAPPAVWGRRSLARTASALIRTQYGVRGASENPLNQVH